MAPPRKRSNVLPPIDVDNLDASLTALMQATIEVGDTRKPWSPDQVFLPDATQSPPRRSKSAKPTKDYARAVLKPTYPVIDPRTVPVRYSSLKEFSKSPDHYHHACQLGREETLAMRMGTGCHAVMFGLHVEVWDGKVRNGQHWDAFKAEHADAIILSMKEHDQAQRMRDKLVAHDLANAIIFAEGTNYEQHLAWSRSGRACSSRPDGNLQAAGHLWDYKTTKSAQPDFFIRDAQRRFYAGQCKFYGEALANSQGWLPETYYLVAQENVKPYTVAVYELTPAALEHAEKITALWWEQLRGCEFNNRWPGYSDAAIEFDAPVENWRPDETDDDDDDDGSDDRDRADRNELTNESDYSV